MFLPQTRAFSSLALTRISKIYIHLVYRNNTHTRARAPQGNCDGIGNSLKTQPACVFLLLLGLVGYCFVWVLGVRAGEGDEGQKPSD